MVLGAESGGRRAESAGREQWVTVSTADARRCHGAMASAAAEEQTGGGHPRESVGSGPRGREERS